MRVLDVIAAGAVVLAVREILRIGKVRADPRDRREALQTWEAEGGAVPVSRSTTVAQVSPPSDAVLSS
jgi:hypothetical protein